MSDLFDPCPYVLNVGGNGYNPVVNCVNQSDPNFALITDWGCPSLFTSNAPVNFNNGDGFGLMTSMGFGAATVGLFAALVFAASVIKSTEGKPQMINFASSIAHGLDFYQRRMAHVFGAWVAVFFASICGVLWNGNNQQCDNYQWGNVSTNTCNPYIGSPGLTTVGVFTSLCFFAGSLMAAAVSYVATHIAVKANVRVVMASTTSVTEAARVALKSGAVVGLTTASLALLGLIICLMILTIGTFDQRLVWQYLVGFGFGASSLSLFVRIGGGILAKSASFGAELADKLNVAPASSINNPAVIVSNLGKLVSELSGSAIAFFESWVGAIIAACILGFSTYSNLNLTVEEKTCIFGDSRIPYWMTQTNYAIASIAYPLWLAGVQIISVMLAMQFVRYAVNEALPAAESETQLSLVVRFGLLVSNLIYVGLSALVSWICFGNSGQEWRLYGCCLIGMAASALVNWWTIYINEKTLYPNKAVAAASDKGPVAFIVEGVTVSGLSTPGVLFVILAVLIACNAIGGTYGVAIAAISVHAAHAIRLAVVSVNPILDTSAKIGELCVADVKDSDVTKLNVVVQAVKSNVQANKAVGVVGTALTATVITFAFVQNTGANQINLDDPVVLAGAFIGACLPFVFISLQLLPFGPFAEFFFLEVKKLVEANPELKGSSVSSKAIGALETLLGGSLLRVVGNLLTPLSVLVATPFVVAFMLGSMAHAATLFAATVSGTFLALTLGQAAALGSQANTALKTDKTGLSMQKAAEVGQAVLDPLADTVAPVVLAFIRGLTMLSLLLAPVFEMVNSAGTVFPTTSWWYGIIVLGVVLGFYFIFHYLGTNPIKAKQNTEFHQQAKKVDE